MRERTGSGNCRQLIRGACMAVLLCLFLAVAAQADVYSPLERNNTRVFRLIRQYYAAIYEKNSDVLSEIVTPWDSAVEENIYASQNTNEFLNLTAYSYDGPERGSYVVYVYYESTVPGRGDLLPTLALMYLKTDLTGKLVVASDWTSDESISSYVQSTMEWEDAAQLITDVSNQYSYIMYGTDPQYSTQPETQDNSEGFSLIHRYEIFLQNGSWDEARDACLRRGGYLACIESREEYEYILEQLERENCRSYRLYIGGFRDMNAGSYDYYWLTDDQSIAWPLNAEGSWCRDIWLSGEPTYKDDVVHAAEDVLEMFYYDDLGRWVWNDIPNDLPKYLNQGNAIGYICEYE